MKQPLAPLWEEQVRTLARAFPYPPTPDLAGAVQQQLTEQRAGAEVARRLRPVWAILLILAFVLAGLFAVPPVRAAILEWLQIGAVRIWLVEPTAVPAGPATVQSETLTPRPTSTPMVSLFGLAGVTTLADAQAKAGFPLRLPTYPSDLGPPAGVFYQELGGPAVVLVWLATDQPARAKLSLHILGPHTFAEKGNVRRIEQTTVHGQTAYWTEGPYLLAYRAGAATDWDLRRLVEGHVLIWVEDGLTYRLETDLTLTEAVRVAESLVATPPPLLNFAGKTTLAQAQAQVGFPIRLPAGPPALGAPDHVFVQQTNGWFVLLIWMEPTDPQRVRLVLYEVGPGVGLSKGKPPVLRTTTVKDRPAVWIEGMHYLEHAAYGWGEVRLIDQDVLVWSEMVDGQEITYRLESGLTADVAVQLAESLR